MFPADGTITDHIANKEMWAGSIGRITSEELVADLIGKPQNGIASYRLYKKKLSVSPALIKMFDEAVVNISDHLARTLKFSLPIPVTLVKLNITDDGTISLENNGQGVPTDYHSVAKMYTPQLVFGEAFKGSNLKKETKLDIGGGTNGVGIKITNTHSHRFELNTTYANYATKKLVNYTQMWAGGMKIVNPPIITETNLTVVGAKDCKTKITFSPNYERFGYSTTNSSDMKEVKQLFIARLHMIAAYMGWLSNHHPFDAESNMTRKHSRKSKNTLHFMVNDDEININSMNDIAKCIFRHPSTDGTQHPNDIKILNPGNGVLTPSSDGSTPAYVWELVVAVSTSAAGEQIPALKNKEDFNKLSNVNGVVVNGGGHITKFREAIIKRVRAKFAEELKVDIKSIPPAQIYKNIYLFMNSTIPNVVWGGGQTKESIQIDKKRIGQYNVPDTLVDSICEALKDRITVELFPLEFNVSISKEFDNKLNSKGMNIEKYDHAKFAGKRGSGKCKQPVLLLIAEGDSAKTSCKNAMLSKNKKTGKSMLDPDYIGIYTFHGNVINARKNIIRESHNTGSSTRVSTTGMERMFLNEKLEQNIFFSNFIKIAGLRFDYKYDPESATFAVEMKSLNYDAFVACTDQDFDGVGKIFTLFSNIIMVFWPNLLKLGFVRRLETPSRRAYPKNGGNVIEFYGDYDYNKWIEDVGGPAIASKKYKVKFVKGMATNEPFEMAHIFSNFHKNVITYYGDKETPHLFETHFGKDASKRKIILETPVTPPTEAEAKLRMVTRRVNFNDHLNFERKEFMFQDLIQKLWNKYDGFNEVGRKIACGLLKLIRGNANSVEERVSQLGNDIAKSMQYHHGEASMFQSIFSMGFYDIGGVQLPLVVLIGEGGTRAMGGADHGSPRYVYATPNKKLLSAMYPRDLISFAKTKLEDGIPAEKEMLIGIIPRGICESAEIPSNGYKIKVHARDVFSVINNVRANILRYKDGVAPVCASLNPYTRGFTGEIRPIKGRLYSFGRYEYNSITRVLTITELPLRVWHENYKTKLMKEKALVKRPFSPSDDDMVRIIDGEIYNYSSSEEIKIMITIAKPNNGWNPIDIINKYALEGYYDGMVGFFGLKKHMDSHIFMTRPDGSVETKFKTYSDVFADWFPEAKALYTLRVEREEAIRDLKIRCLRQHIRYITEYDTLGITKMETNQADEILVRHGYVKYNHTYLKQVGERTDHAKVIYEGVLNIDISFDYLYRTTDYMKHKTPLDNMKAKLKRMEEEFAKYLSIINEPPFKGARLWINELYDLEDVCREGFKTGWKYDSGEKYVYN